MAALPDLDAVRSILVVKLSSLGDVVHVTPCLRALRLRWPQARIIMAVERSHADVVRGNPHLDGLLEALPVAGGAWGQLWQIHRLLAGHNGPRFDLCLDFQGVRRSALWVYLSRARWQIGLGDWRPGWTRVVRPNRQQHAVRVCADVLTTAGVHVADLAPEVHVCPTADARVADLLQRLDVEPQDYLLLNPFSRWRSKEWPAERWAELVRRLGCELGVRPVLVGSPDELDRAERLLAQLEEDSVVSLVGTLTLGQALAVYRRAAVLVSGDSGPLHLAAALGTPVVALFGPTWPERTGPWGSGHCVLQARRPPTHFAYRTDAGGEFMRALPVEPVFQAVAAALAVSGRQT